MKKSGLRSAEWGLAGSFILILAALVLVAKVKVYKASDTLKYLRTHPSHKTNLLFPVTIQGAVKKPATYQIKSGMPLKKVLAKAKPKNNANLRHLDLDKGVFDPMELTIEELDEIQVKVMVEEGVFLEFQLPPGSRICDLKSKIEFSDVAVFKSKRKLKDGEIVDLPKIVAGNEKRSYDR